MEFFRPLLELFFRLLDLVEMPWQASLFLLCLILLLFSLLQVSKRIVGFVGKLGMKLVELAVRMFLLPEYLVSSLFRRLKLRSLPGIDIYDELVEAVGRSTYNMFERISKIQERKIRFPVFLTILIVSIPIAAWYLRYYAVLQDSPVGSYIDRGFTAYEQLKRLVLEN
ncbi:hypothetical protein [Chloroflexus aurantiacus]